jgi:uncharacterized protein (TIGR00255 family)
MLKSMTGFGSADGTVGSSRVSVELRTVNHRFFNPSLKLPSALSKWEPEVREALRKRIARGHVTVTARIERVAAAESTLGVDEVKFSEVAKALIGLRDRHGLGGDIDVPSVLRMPGVMSSAPVADDAVEGAAEELVAVVEVAITELSRMRESEGARLAEVLRERMTVVEQALQRIAVRSPERVIAQRDRLRENVKLLAGGIAVDEQRLAQEIAILADRLDVGEELDRFAAHIGAFREALTNKDSEAVGKRLGFLLQEMLREANTTGSKANDSTIQRDVVTVKEELEVIREQVENLE